MLTAFAAAFVAFNVSSCSKGNSTTNPAAVTESDAAQVTTDAVTPSTGGLVSQVNSASTLYSSEPVAGGAVSVAHTQHSLNRVLTCGVPKDSSLTYASNIGAVPAYNYSLMWKYTLACTAPSSLNLNFNGSGSYSGLLFTSNFTSTGGFVLTGLGATVPQYNYSSNYSRTGTTTSKVGAQKTFNHTLTITSSSILYNKATQEIASGTATVAIKITSSTGNTYNYGGTLTFLGNKTAKLVLNSGAVYPITWL